MKVTRSNSKNVYKNKNMSKLLTVECRKLGASGRSAIYH